MGGIKVQNCVQSIGQNLKKKDLLGGPGIAGRISFMTLL